jgi:hypothetical protein
MMDSIGGWRRLGVIDDELRAFYSRFQSSWASANPHDLPAA